MKFFEDDKLIQAVLSRPQKEVQKVLIVPLQIRNKKRYQFTVYSNHQAFHCNLDPKEAETTLQEYLEKFKEAHFYTYDADYVALKNKKGDWRWISSKPTKKTQMKVHNREKKYFLGAAVHAVFWKKLDVANAHGKIKPEKQGKFRQVNRFIEIISDILPALPQEGTLHIVDFGCGKAYLTFALYEYLVNTLNRKVKITGIDRKEQVVADLEKIREELNYQDLQFVVGDIKTFQLTAFDLVISLHACDTATDDILEKAIVTGAKVILAVPCCQHAFYSQIKQLDLKPILKHGILKERFAALATDAARATLLEASGYTVQVIEFIDTEHTPKNLMLKAIKSSHPKDKAYQEYRDFLSYLNIKSLA